MAQPSPFAKSSDYRPAETLQLGELLVPSLFRDAVTEYADATAGAALLDRSERVIVEVTGKDRASWLHNLVTNAVKSLDESHGNYAFACDVRGRIQFDLNILVRADALWLDLDAGTALRAMQHFDRYLITEDVKLRLQADRFARLAIIGPKTWEVGERLGLMNGEPLPDLAHVDAGDTTMVKHALAGGRGFELFVPIAAADAWWSRAAAAGATPTGRATLDVLRIEAGIPWLGRDLDDTVLPAETGQIERAISYHKGCYLGQEVIERMRAYNSLARRLVKLSMTDGAGLALPTPLRTAERDAGRITSLARQPQTGEWVGLGYLRTQYPTTTELSAGDPPRAVRALANAT